MNEKAKVLYVDDDEFNLELLEVILSKQFCVITASNGYDALEKLKDDSEIKVVVSDVKMPGMDGIELVGKANVLYPHIKYFLFTGVNMNDEIQHALQSGVIEKTFSKPINRKEVVDSIAKAVAG